MTGGHADVSFRHTQAACQKLSNLIEAGSGGEQYNQFVPSWITVTSWIKFSPVTVTVPER